MTLSSTPARRCSSSPDGARMDARARSMARDAPPAGGSSRWGLAVAVVNELDIFSSWRESNETCESWQRHVEAPVRKRRKTPPDVLLQGAVDFGNCKAGPRFRDATEDVPPRID